MTKEQLQDRVRKIKSILYGIIDELDILQTSPKFDEDYKVKRYINLTDDNFDYIVKHAYELKDAFIRRKIWGL